MVPRIEELGREGEREGEKHQCVAASCMPHTGDLAHNPSMCPENQTGDPLLHIPALNPLSHTSQGYVFQVLKNQPVRGVEVGPELEVSGNIGYSP